MLDERKMKILSAIIDDYIATAEPIGSRTIARKYHIGISPATIRNEMADLEELGYLSQPHTSAGRIPSNKGYRFYVDFLMPSRKLDDYEQSIIKRLLKKRAKELEELIEEAGKVISKLTSYTAIILGPQLESSRLKHVQIIRLEEKKGLMIIVTNYSTVSHHIIEIPQNLTDSDLQRISNALNSSLAGKALEDITQDVMNSIKDDMIEYDNVLNFLLDLLMENLDDTKENNRVYASGSSKMLEFPEFRDVERARNFLSLMEKHDLIIRALKTSCKPNNITVTIGSENPWSEFQELSIVTTGFFVEDKNLGICGIIGPTRMEYSRVFSILEKVTDYLNKAISSLL
ncbi:MAG: heat-inducible transcriptional repressor HrcA [Tepidanaerobacteraceae bacterium]|jgi:heat-inducible transcriptional repressor|nr:heat-inducible transcriptional repressor HrcA [Tepidanaerobacteraceae bacterium]